MLLDDSIELECNDSSNKVEALPVNWDIDLSKIWIPSSILPNRKRQVNPNENKPFILYSLEKPDYSKTVSVYSDECPHYHESQTLDVLPRVSPHKLKNDYKNKHEVQQTLPSSQNAVEWNARSDICSENLFSKNQINHKKPGVPIRDCEKTFDPMSGNAAQREKKTSDPSIHEAIYRASLEDLTRRMAEILSEDEPLKENWYHEDVIKTSQVTSSSALNSILSSTKDSLEELYYSDEDGNQFAAEYELNSLELESPEKKPTCSIYSENSNVQEQISESFVNSLEQSKNGSDKTAIQSFEEDEKIQYGNQKVSVDITLGQGEHRELNGIECEVHAKDYKQELLHCAEKLEDPTKKVLAYPFSIAYKRPPLHEQTQKPKTQKGKKKTKKTKKNINLEDFFESEEVDRFKVPEFDEFYENLVRQGKCKPLNQDSNGFPSANFTEELQTIGNEFPSLNQQGQSQTSFWDSAQKFRESLGCKSQSNSPKEIIKNEERDGPKLESRASLETLVIDNIPLDVSQENIENFVLGYGELKNLTIERYEKFQRAKLQMDFMCEIDWIIDCLNGSQPFGRIGKELIKCYRQA